MKYMHADSSHLFNKSIFLPSIVIGEKEWWRRIHLLPTSSNGLLPTHSLIYLQLLKDCGLLGKWNAATVSNMYRRVARQGFQERKVFPEHCANAPPCIAHTHPPITLRITQHYTTQTLQVRKPTLRGTPVLPSLFPSTPLRTRLPETTLPPALIKCEYVPSTLLQRYEDTNDVLTMPRKRRSPRKEVCVAHHLCNHSRPKPQPGKRWIARQFALIRAHSSLKPKLPNDRCFRRYERPSRHIQRPASSTPTQLFAIPPSFSPTRRTVRICGSSRGARERFLET